MKTTLKYLIISFLLVLTSCSSDDELINYYNKINYNGEQVYDDTFTEISNEYQYIKKSDDFLMITYEYYTENPWNFHRIVIIFDKYGNFGSAYKVNISTNTVLYNFTYNSGANFHFELEDYDEEKGTAKGNYSGKLYTDPEDKNSDFVTLEGSFFTKVTEQNNGGGVDRPFAKLKMNGVDWRPTRQLNNVEFPLHDEAAKAYISDDEFKLVVGYLKDNQEQLHSFDNTNTDFFVKLGKYNAVTNQFDYYTSSQGTLNITEAGYLPYNGGYYCVGTFSFIATNTVAPFDIITITEGSFNIPF